MRVLMWGALALLAGCAGTAPQYYSLQAPAIADTTQVGQVAGDYIISVQPVLIPQELSRPQILVSGPESAEVVPLSTSLWSGPLESQIRDALAASLARHLNVLEVGTTQPDGVPVWNIYVDVQRFDSLYGREVVQEAVWRLVPQGMKKPPEKRLCSGQVRVPVGEGMSRLVAGHRQALNLLAEGIASTLPGGQGGVRDAATQEGQLVLRGCARVS
ncbi:MAG: membrane integrity-associated transporter subunit PqiC [Anaerolineaceae bacterium]|nr:membrane integrity-associated transporter subunit PqiC [Anaerolineaceae bacterium]